MKKNTINFKKLYNLLLLLLLSISSNAQDSPFNCDSSAYLFQFNDVYSIDLASGNSFLIASDVTSGNINAAAYNPADGYLWGSLTSPQKSIVRIGKNFETTTFYIDELPTNNRYVGDINSDGIYYLKGGGTTYYKIDLDPDSDNFSQHLATESLSQSISIHDWAFNAVDGNLYTVEKNTNILYRIDPTNSQVQSLGEVPILSGLSYTYGAVYFDASGRFYVSANQTGTIYVIQDVQDLNENSSIQSNLFAFGPSSSSNDGARCPTAPVPQEDCSNGIDDDGDGLIDCEDPSCSGYVSCPVIQAPTSGANDGGLESNNRLSEKINHRNFNRAKSSYKFDSNLAKRVTKDSNYAQRSSNSNFQLQDFVPLGTINEDYVVESTPTDLINITNASEVYSVDYIENDQAVASVLALKTDNGVYEHTKYICDRLLGAELLSVSTLDINGQQFIKSLIRNADGTVEFVLGLSVKVVNNGSNFAIESHWNLDLYEDNITFYNFQIWSNSLDDLYVLGEEVLNLLNIEKSISSYNNSAPPTVFVKKGKYINGNLDLQIINTNGTGGINFDAGYRITETSDFDYVTSSINLNQDYITNVQLETGKLFDIGFRIGNGFNTPDDLFMSDGPWGIDDSQPNTTVNNFSISTNDYSYDDEDFPIERNLTLNATTSTYFAAYRAVTPRFKAVDLSGYNSFNLQAKGTGNLEITLVKQSISNWESQHKTTIVLNDTIQDFAIPFSNFTSQNGTELVLDDIVTIVFTMASEDGMVVTKEMNLQNVRFSRASTLSKNNISNENKKLRAFPNPFKSSTTIMLQEKARFVEIQVMDVMGRLIDLQRVKTEANGTRASYQNKSLRTGIYNYILKVDYNQNYFGTFLID